MGSSSFEDELALEDGWCDGSGSGVGSWSRGEKEGRAEGGAEEWARSSGSRLDDFALPWRALRREDFLRAGGDSSTAARCFPFVAGELVWVLFPALLGADGEARVGSGVWRVARGIRRSSTRCDALEAKLHFLFSRALRLHSFPLPFHAMLALRLSALLAGLLWSTNTAYAAPTPSVCNGQAAYCARLYSNVSVIGAHNSYSVGAGNVGANQNYTVKTQLENGIRLIQVQGHMNNGSIHLCHTSYVQLSSSEPFIFPLVSAEQPLISTLLTLSQLQLFAPRLRNIHILPHRRQNLARLEPQRSPHHHHLQSERNLPHALGAVIRRCWNDGERLRPSDRPCRP